MNKLGPSLMCTDLGNVEQDIKELDNAAVDFYHIDVMDGVFVPNFGLNIDFVKRVREITEKPLDVHLMVTDPSRYIDTFAEAGADMISIHAEATTNLQGDLARIQAHGLKAGVAINPATSLDVLEYVYDVTDYVVVMTVNPGFAGQKFIPAIYDKIQELSDQIKKRGLKIEIQVDGNIGENTIPKCKDNGATMYIGGSSAVYNSAGTLEENVKKTKQLLV
ncbi:ribulose-phosphate 3-epimerase [Enterococcus faecium]|uniref:ribulose-phosphate 3-epimerase n=1 Tax=Enterococcus TaxID=1350 RepID=UPI0001CEA55F|nr:MULTISPECIES: ribulose-phosphate 3-epimerase [Enterococcus]MDP8584281.1 ribulose-phosphate 3-epimerase [Listeria innocua]EFF19697.1 ribulose-phosphate 3-epimerase [Enterococcus faecium E1071]EGP5099023.1 ribulose-phosphate 3-epimerase [Enterococcus faecium]EGP5533388.1 ribulose-phosphate 3-epimerase [Enterococcus faecium]ELA56787.1 ribulose-phosphate 3-epimerase [Enterococcus faecium EnGen0022]